jgi:hypothetical protein
MSSKKYRQKRCAYCGGESSTADHVVAREFFDEERRNDLIKVPACHPCNNRKSKLEHYACAVLPFGSDHEAAVEVFPGKVEKRLNRNLKLKRHLAAHKQTIWMPTASKILVPTMQLSVSEERITELFRLIGRGLLFHHGGDSFLVIPLAGAFFIDIVNALVIRFFANLPIISQTGVAF